MKLLMLILVASVLSGCVVRPLYPYHDDYYGHDHQYRGDNWRGGGDWHGGDWRWGRRR